MIFNLYKNQQNLKFYKKAAQLSNGRTTINLPNGQGPGMGDGIQLTNMEGTPLQNNNTDSMQLKDVIGDLLYEIFIPNSNIEKIKTIAASTINAQIPPEFNGQDDLMKMVVALGRRSQEDPQKTSINLDTGEKENNIEDIATSIAKMAGWNIKELINNARDRNKTRQDNKMSFTNKNMSSIKISKKRNPVENTKDEQFKKEEEEDPTKKRKKGNPFKVLMGLVGKMLDHGMGRREIINKVMKQKGNKWQEETVEKCIKVVQNSRKKEYVEKKSMDNKFNLYKYAQDKKISKEKDVNIKDFETRDSIYDIHRNIKLMSTMELISRLAYINGLLNFDMFSSNENNGVGKSIDSRQFKKDLESLKNELARRNYSKEEIDILQKTVQGRNPQE